MKFKIFKVLFSSTFFLFFSGCATTSDLIDNGIWNFELQREDGTPINFQVEAVDSAGMNLLYLVNAEEKILVDNIRQEGDSILVELPFFNSSFRIKKQSGNLEGLWIKDLGTRDQVMPFTATKSQERFEAKENPAFDISGRWETVFTQNDGREIPAIGEFYQTGTYLKGTFLLPSGDYRYLQGIVSGDSLKLSTFNGNAAYYFTARIENDSTLIGGKFYSGPTGLQTWEALKNETASLEGKKAGTALNPGQYSINFSFPSTEGEMISLSDERFRNKVVIVQIMGSWCPNCMDETAFLSDYYNKNKDRGLEIIALAYERTADFNTSVKSVSSFQKRFNINYPVLITGVAVSDSLRTEKTLPQLNKISYFPTTIFIDRKGIVRKIHEGFTGPGTGEHYLKYIKEFNELVNKMLEE